MKINDDLKRVLYNLARCRKCYQRELTEEEQGLLLENTMAEIQCLLLELGIDFQQFDENEYLE